MRRQRYIIALLLSVLCSSSVPLFLEYFTPYVDAWTVNGYRYVVVFLIIFPIIIVFSRAGKYTQRMWKVALIPALFNFLQQITWAWAPYFIEPGMIGFLVKSTVVWSIAGSFLIFVDERFLLQDKRFWMGLMLSLTGFFGLSYFGEGLSLGGTFFGVMLVLVSSLFMASYGLAVKRYFNETSALVSFSIIAFYTALGLVALMFVLGEPQAFLRIPLKINLIIAVSAFVGINVAHVLFYISLKHLGVMVSYSVSLFSAFFTALLSYLIFNERLSLLQWLSGSFIIAGGVIIIAARNRKQNHKQTEILRGVEINEWNTIKKTGEVK